MKTIFKSMKIPVLALALAGTLLSAGSVLSTPLSPGNASEAAAQLGARKVQLQKNADENAERTAAELARASMTAFQQEKRDERWAPQKESTLRGSFVRSGLAPGALKSVECRSSTCQLEIAPGADPMEAFKGQITIGNWLSASEPCGYTTFSNTSDSAQVPGSVRVYLQCAK
jgi:hypothetical protein